MPTSPPVPLPANLIGMAGVQPLELEVVATSELGPRMRRIVLSAPNLASFDYAPGQDVMLVLDMAGDRPLSRRYTIRNVDQQARTLELNIVAHGVQNMGPGARWAAAAQPGDRVNGVGPRGKIFLNPAADWHLFAGDETGAPMALRMLEALAPATPGLALLEVVEPADELPVGALSGNQQVQWLHRGATPAAAASRLLQAALGAAEHPPGRGHVYIAGEVQLATSLRAAALARGLAPEQVSAKAYWGRGQANAARGEPDARVP